MAPLNSLVTDAGFAMRTSLQRVGCACLWRLRAAAFVEMGSSMPLRGAR